MTLLGGTTPKVIREMGDVKVMSIVTMTTGQIAIRAISLIRENFKETLCLMELNCKLM